MLTINALMPVAAVASVASAVFSPSYRSSCKKVVAPSRFRYDPYNVRVLQASSDSLPPVDSSGFHGALSWALSMKSNPQTHSHRPLSCNTHSQTPDCGIPNPSSPSRPPCTLLQQMPPKGNVFGDDGAAPVDESGRDTPLVLELLQDSPASEVARTKSGQPAAAAAGDSPPDPENSIKRLAADIVAKYSAEQRKCDEHTVKSLEKKLVTLISTIHQTRGTLDLANRLRRELDRGAQSSWPQLSKVLLVVFASFHHNRQELL
eukprot:CAMPEP_0176431928 /NCGR_PEP_ID=MMETSP0127-20121128/15087_1 /TAXON_ID=938130 /ORGANISM="Platyophrya macrostoma, Strain WH" /LENGTH=260 /DNA_ID=CAMNT_0017813995 /DNA_START=63 /DNA_END=842 /DNA_ORIENTATION=+